MNRKKCPICGKNNTSIVMEKYQMCASCKAVWILRFPNVKYDKKYYEAKSNFLGKIFRPIESLLYFIRNCYVGLNEKNIWIDVGAGEGKFLSSVNAKKKIGVEVSTAGRKMMKKVGIETLSEKEFLKLKNTNADVISFWHVLEHIKEPWKYLKSASKNLSKNGKVIIGIPNIESIDYKIFKKNWFHLAPNHHLWHLSKKSIRILLSQVNMEIQSVDYFSPEHHLSGLIQSFINKTSGSYNLLHTILKRNTSFEKVEIIDLLWIIFWLTVGLPFVILFWITSSLLKTSGTFVIIAVRK